MTLHSLGRNEDTYNKGHGKRGLVPGPSSAGVAVVVLDVSLSNGDLFERKKKTTAYPGGSFEILWC